MDRHTPEQRRRNMQAIKSKNTKAEVLLAKTLWSLGYRYRKNNATVFGRPDITFKKLNCGFRRQRIFPWKRFRE